MASTITAAVPSATVLRHTAVLISGDVRPRGSGVVVLQRYVGGRWVQLAHAASGRTGHYAFPVTASSSLGTSIYRVLRGGSSGAAGVISRTVHLRTVSTAFRVTAASRPAVASGSPVVVTGSVSPKAGGVVALQVLSRGVWHSVATRRLTRKARFSLSYLVATGVYTMRVSKAATATIAGGVSRPVTVTVTVPPAAPTTSISLAGDLLRAGVYGGSVTASAVTTAPAGVKMITYVLDGAPAKAYTSPVVVAGEGAHSVTVTVTDTLNRTAAASASWTTQGLQGQPVLPTATISLSGSLSGGGTYVGAVTASVAVSDAGGPGVATVQYVLDGGSAIPYAGGVVVPGPGNHTLTVTVTDSAGAVGTATRNWSEIATADHTPPTGSISLAGSPLGASSYSGVVSVTISGDDGAGGSGVASISYTLDSGPSQAYAGAFAVTGNGGHTVVATVTDRAGNVSAPITRIWTQQPVAGGPNDILVSSADQATLGLPTARLVFSSYVGDTAAIPAKQLSFTNTSSKTLTVTNIVIGGVNAGSYSLSPGQTSAFALLPAATALVSVVFHPSAPTGCPFGAPGTATSVLIGANVVQVATLTYTTDDSGQPGGSADLSGVDACFQGGNGEPVFDQVLAGLGYTTQVDSPDSPSRRFIGPLRYLRGTDEISSPYFVAANAAAPVSLVPLAHYATGSTAPGGYLPTGWYAQGAAMTPEDLCTAACRQLFNFPPDPSATTYNQDQKLLPAQSGGTTFTPAGPFGLFSGDFTDVNYSDDGLNIGHTTSNTDLPVPHYLHDMRVYPAYGPGRVPIPNTYLIGLDVSRVPAFKNNDFQDLVFLLSNAVPSVDAGPVLSGASDTVDLTNGGSVSPTCAVTGFDGVLPGTGNPCDPAKISFSSSGLSLTSGPGQLATNGQQNALFKTFDATRGAFTITTRVVGGINALTTDYQQIGAFFGTDQNNFVKIEVEHNGPGAPRLTMFDRVNGGPGMSVTTIQPAGLTTASTVDLVIKADPTLADPLPFGDTYGVSGYPLDQVNVWYRLDSGPLTQVGSVSLLPADVTQLFSRSAKAGILDSNSGTTTPLTATFSNFSIVTG